ncbi:MAG: aminotransferase [Verrucomicrobiota bacterium]
MNTLSFSELQDLDELYHIHPFTNHTDLYKQRTYIIQKAEGCFVYDEKNRKLLDALAGLWCVNVGYGRTEIVDAVCAQMKSVAFYPSFFNTTTEATIRLSEKLAKIAPKRLNHTVYSNSGSESNETNLKIIRNYWKLKGEPQRIKILSRQYAYHGVGVASTSLTGLPNCQQPFDLPLPGFIHLPAPHPYGANSDLSPEDYGQWCIQETVKRIEIEGAHTIAAFFVEPIQGAGGVIVPPQSYLKQIRQICRDFGILFVADEVITGFGRLGEWFASNLWDLDPDLMSLAKGITSGYIPLGASMMSDEIAEVITKQGYFAHGFTYSGHPTATAAAVANLNLIEKENLIPRVRDDVGPYFQKKLQEFKGHPAVGEIRGCQLIGAIELLPENGKAGIDPTKPLGLKASKIARENGVIIRGIRDLIAVAPPLVITREEIDLLFSAIRKTIDSLWEK